VDFCDRKFLTSKPWVRWLQSASDAKGVLLRSQMRATASQSSRKRTRLELVLLLLAASAVSVVLTVAAVQPPGEPASDTTSTSNIILALVVAGLALLATVVIAKTSLQARFKAKQSRIENQNLRRNLATAEAMIQAEPQVLVYWEHARPPQVVTHSLSGVPGLPRNQQEFLRFNFWLETQSAQLLKSSLDTLFVSGQSFNIILKTSAGAHVEADGRAAGGRAVLRFRDVAGYKQDLAVIFNHHANLARDVRGYRSILDVQPNPAWLRSTDKRLIWVNQAYVAAVEAASEDEVLERQIELLESRQRKDVEAAHRKNIPYRNRVQIVVGGERKAHDVTELPLGDGVAGIAIDVDALETAQGELDRYLETYDRTLDRVTTAVAVFGPDMRLTFHNEAYEKLWGLEDDWLQTKPTDGDILDRLRDLGRLPEVVHYREWREKILKVYEAGNEVDDWWHLADGRALHVMAEQRPDGGVTYLYVDETERFALESKYNALIRVQSETLNSLKEGVAVYGTDGRLTLSNVAFASIWKLPKRTLDSLPHIDDFVRTANNMSNDADVLQKMRNSVVAFSDERQQVQGQMRRTDASVIDYASTPLPDGGTLLTFVDVTDSKRYERALIERNEALIAADGLKNRFIGHVSYQLRTPLTNIIGFSDLLASNAFGSLNDKQREYLMDINASSNTLLTIIDGLLELATIDAGNLELQVTDIDPNNVIDSAIDAIRQSAARAKLTLDIAIADDIPRFPGDQSRVKQILSNLLSNAVGFSKPEGLVRVSCWNQDGFVHFSVEDQGIGIPKDQQEKIFERFVSDSMGSDHRGAGLGLAVAKSLVELHGGDMSLESELGQGTTITVRFPEQVPVSVTSEHELGPDAAVAYSKSG
jgi:signal transduction histidine kinase